MKVWLFFKDFWAFAWNVFGYAVTFCLVIALVVSPIFLIWAFIEYLNEWNKLSKGKTKIKFRTFKHFYNINPDRWRLWDDYVTCIVGKEPYEEYDWVFDFSNHRYERVSSTRYVDKTQDLAFDFIDYIKYRWWLRTKEKHKAEKSHTEVMSQVINVVKKDIENLEALAEKQINEGIDSVNNVLSNLQEERERM